MTLASTLQGTWDRFLASYRNGPCALKFWRIVVASTGLRAPLEIPYGPFCQLRAFYSYHVRASDLAEALGRVRSNQYGSRGQFRPTVD